MQTVELSYSLKYFLPHERIVLTALIANTHKPGQPSWVLTDDGSADVIILNENASESSISQTITNELKWKRPVAQLAIPHAQSGAQLHYSSDTSFTDTAQRLFSRLEEMLTHVIAWHCLATVVYEHLLAGNSSTKLWNLEYENCLVAVVDFKSQMVGLQPQAIEFTPDFADTVWIRKPSNARMPESFVTQTLPRMMWQFAKRSQLDLLPEKFWKDKFSLLKLPTLPIRDLSTVELAVINYLVQHTTCTMQDMIKHLEIDGHVLARHIAGLFLVGAIIAQEPRSGLFYLFQMLMGQSAQEISHSTFSSEISLTTSGMMPLTDYPNLI